MGRLMDDIDRRIINSLQEEIPICKRPYFEAATRLGISEKELIRRLSKLIEDRVLTRIGPLYQIEKIGGAFTLAALHAPMDKFECIAMQVNDFPQVAHNYAREHDLNMWFVIATERPEEIDEVIAKISIKTGCKVFNFPKSREYFIE